MNRREFLKLAGTYSLASLAGLGLPLGLSSKVAAIIEPRASLNGKLLRGTAQGQVFTSLDGGQTWIKTAAFGPQFSVVDLSASGGQFQARLNFQGHDLDLHSPDGHLWQTMQKG